jgi:hypothetical protein
MRGHPRDESAQTGVGQIWSGFAKKEGMPTFQNDAHAARGAIELTCLSSSNEVGGDPEVRGATPHAHGFRQMKSNECSPGVPSTTPISLKMRP